MSSQRHEDARRREQLAESSARGEAEAAQRLIDDFVGRAREQGIAPEPLRAITANGQSVKTDRTGWYLRRNHSIAIGTDGGYYVLTLALNGGLTSRWRGVHLDPTPPSLVVGRGGRDGETGDLSWFLERRLSGTWAD